MDKTTLLKKCTDLAASLIYSYDEKEREKAGAQMFDMLVSPLLNVIEERDNELRGLRSAVARINAELQEMEARAVSLVFHIPGDTLAGDIQKWRDEMLALRIRREALTGRACWRTAVVPERNPSGDAERRTVALQRGPQYVETTDTMNENVRRNLDDAIGALKNAVRWLTHTPSHRTEEEQKLDVLAFCSTARAKIAAVEKELGVGVRLTDAPDQQPRFSAPMLEALAEQELQKSKELQKPRCPDWPLNDADPNCKHKIRLTMSGYKCSKCGGWYCL